MQYVKWRAGNKVVISEISKADVKIWKTKLQYSNETHL